MNTNYREWILQFKWKRKKKFAFQKQKKKQLFFFDIGYAWEISILINRQNKNPRFHTLRTYQVLVDRSSEVDELKTIAIYEVNKNNPKTEKKLIGPRAGTI